MKRYALYICLIFLLIAAGIPAVFASTSITGVSPISAPNNGVVTLTITGAELGKAYSTYLVKCGSDGTGGGRAEGTIVSATATKVVATYDLTGVRVGTWTVRVHTHSAYSGLDDMGEWFKQFTVYSSTGSGYTDTTTTTTTTEPKTYATAENGDNSVFFQTDPSGATIFVDGDEVGTSTFTYKTYKDGVHEVLIKKIGYEDYSDRVTIIENQRVLFSAVLTPLSPGSATTTTGAGTTPVVTGKPQANVTTVKKSTLKMPTPLGTDPPLAEEAPIDPALALLAAGIGIVIVAVRRR